MARQTPVRSFSLILTLGLLSWGCASGSTAARDAGSDGDGGAISWQDLSTGADTSHDASVPADTVSDTPELMPDAGMTDATAELAEVSSPDSTALDAPSKESSVPADLDSFSEDVAADTAAADTVAETGQDSGDSCVEGACTGLKFIAVPGGTYSMGCSPGDTWCEASEKPAHPVTVPGFEILETEVTEQQYEAVIGSNPSCHDQGISGPDMPVECVDWSQARAFCQAIGGRLPTEAEWEYAARGGTTTRYYCGDDFLCLDGIAWHQANSLGQKHAVKGKAPNAFGLYDMLGNMFEWAEDHYYVNYGGAPSDGSAWVWPEAALRIIRGGSCLSPSPNFVRSTSRSWDYPEHRYVNLGFRCARSAQ